MSGPRAQRGVEVAPLRQRAAAMLSFRFAESVVLIALSGTGAIRPGGADAFLLVVYLVISCLLSATVLAPAKDFAVRGFGASLLVDGVFLQYAHERLGHSVAVDTVIAAHLAAACLVASFRTGLKVTVWQSLLMMVSLRMEESRLVPSTPAMAGIHRENAIVTDMALLWLVVLTTASAAWINERELRRRRQDAESVEALSLALLSDQRTSSVLERLVGFALNELGAQRVVLLQRNETGSTVLAASDNVTAPDGWGTARAHHRSEMIDRASRHGAPVTARSLDSATDPLLADLLPHARRLAVVPLGDDDSTWLVLEAGPGWFGAPDLDRRIVAAAAQVAAAAAIALSRAQLIEAAQRAASTDGLTGMANRRTFDETMRELLDTWKRTQQPFALILADVDKFKSVNDRYGHQVGDEVLQAVATVFGQVAGENDLPARYGGEEFALVMRGATTEQAAAQAERLRVALHDIEKPVRVSASFGVGSIPQDAVTVEAVIQGADEALMHAKQTGRDRVVLARDAAGAGAMDAVPAAR